jgi:urease accessory protein
MNHQPLRSATLLRAEQAAGAPAPLDIAVLAHDERHLRRKLVPLQGGGRVLVDLPEPVMLHGGDRLVLDDGSNVAIVAAHEALHEIVPRDRLHLAQLCWHIGNRHLAAAIGAERIHILRDHVIRQMLEGLGATVNDVTLPFEPLRGAYSGHGHGHGHHGHHANAAHGHGSHDHHHDHD